MRLIFRRGSSIKLRFLRVRFFIAIVLAIMTIIVDSRIDLFINIRTYMEKGVEFFYILINRSQNFFNHISDTLETREKLIIKNRMLLQELLLKSSDQLLLEHYKKENIRLRELLDSPLRHGEKKMVTQVISTNIDSYHDQVVIDKGIDDGVYIGQPVINDKGVVGQVIATNNITSRVLLICDSSHSLSIQILRNYIPLIISGNGCSNWLKLENLPSNIDIKVGDILVTSGLEGRFPEGYPVAIVSSVKIDRQRSYTKIQARPTADFQSLRYLLLIWVETERD